MDAQMIALIGIMALVLIVLPVVLGRSTGRSPVEILLGKRAADTFFRRRKKENASDGDEGRAADKDQNTDNNSDQEEEGGQEREAGKTSQSGNKSKTSGKQKNSSTNDLMKAISRLLTFGRKKHFYCIVPGTLEHGDDVASLAVLMVTKDAVLGFNCFGYGGTIYGASGYREWKQVINGEEKKFESPVVRNKKQRDILEAVLKECGHTGIRTEIYGVFTAPDVVMRDHRGTYCHTADSMMEILQGRRFAEDGALDPKEIGKELQTHCKKQSA